MVVDSDLLLVFDVAYLVGIIGYSSTDGTAGERNVWYLNIVELLYDKVWKKHLVILDHNRVERCHDARIVIQGLNRGGENKAKCEDAG